VQLFKQHKYYIINPSYYGEIMELKLNLSLEQINIILAALGKIPYEAAAPVVDAIRQQAQPQLQAQEEQPPTE